MFGATTVFLFFLRFPPVQETSRHSTGLECLRRSRFLPQSLPSTPTFTTDPCRSPGDPRSFPLGVEKVPRHLLGDFSKLFPLYFSLLLSWGFQRKNVGYGDEGPSGLPSLGVRVWDSVKGGRFSGQWEAPGCDYGPGVDLHGRTSQRSDPEP